MERRKFIRFDALLDAFQLHDMVLAPPEKIKSRIKNISREGLRLFTENLLPKGSSVELEMNVPGDNVSIFASSEVVWSRKLDAGYDSGLCFKDIKKEDKFRLLDYAYEQWRKFMGKKAE